MLFCVELTDVTEAFGGDASDTLWRGSPLGDTGVSATAMVLLLRTGDNAGRLQEAREDRLRRFLALRWRVRQALALQGCPASIRAARYFILASWTQEQILCESQAKAGQPCGTARRRSERRGQRRFQKSDVGWQRVTNLVLP